MTRDHAAYCAAQAYGLQQLAKLLLKFEVNFGISPPGSDMGYIEMMDTTSGKPRPLSCGLHAVYDPHTKSYDIWKWGRKRPNMKETNLSAEDAAEVLATAYFVAKARLVRKLHPEMTMPEIIKMLRQGYQREPSQTDRTTH